MEKLSLGLSHLNIKNNRIRETKTKRFGSHYVNALADKSKQNRVELCLMVSTVN